MIGSLKHIFMGGVVCQMIVKSKIKNIYLELSNMKHFSHSRPSLFTLINKSKMNNFSPSKVALYRVIQNCLNIEPLTNGDGLMDIFFL